MVFRKHKSSKRVISPAARSGTGCNFRPVGGRGGEADAKNWRFNALMVAMVLIVGVIIMRLLSLQVWGHEELTEKARDQHEFFEKLKAKRGQIFIKDGEDNLIPIATNEDKDVVFIVPKYIEDIEGTVKTLATILSLDEEEIRRKALKREDLYEVIKRKLTPQESDMIREKKMPGVELAPESWREYPEGELASQILGFVGFKDDKRVGQYGIEGYYNEVLEGEAGFVKAEKDTAGRWISISKRTMERPRNGTDIVLTLDQSIQYFVEKLLKESVEKYGAISGSIIVLDPKTGQVKAMANFPTFSSEKFNEVEDAAVFKNKCVLDQYEPGSVFKPLTASIPLDLGKLEPDSTYDDTGSYAIAGFTIHNSDGKAYGKTTLTRFLELSLNTGAIWAMQSAGKENFLKYLKKYGLGQPTKIELMGEASGDIDNLDYLRDINFVTAAFGQGVSVTPVQLITAFSTVINGGKLMKPQIVERFIADDDSEEVIEPKEVNQVISGKTSATMRAMLISVVKNGWGKKAGVPGYLIGGKTGTAQVPNPNGGGYSSDTIHTFVGFGPGDDPQFATLVKLDHVSAVNFASDSVALVTGKLNKFLLDYYNIFPTEEIKDEELAYFNRLMELREEDIKKVGEKVDGEGAEGTVYQANTKKDDDEDKDKKDKKDKKKKD